MKTIKRDGTEENSDNSEIVMAVTETNTAAGKNKLSPRQIKDITDYAGYKCVKLNRAVSVEEIQGMVENQIMFTGAFELAKGYTRYCYQRSLIRKADTAGNCIPSLIECSNEDVKQRNSNKNPVVSSVQRDCMADEVSKDLTERILFPQDTVEAGRESIVHFHDSDYFAQRIHNCDLVNLEDVLQNGTVISGTRIKKPHSFSTVYNIATQIIAQIANNQYGGQSISLTHLAPLVGVSRRRVCTKVQEEVKTPSCIPSEKVIREMVENRLRKEVTKGIQTIQYQVITLMATDGQAPFLTMFVCLNETKNEWEKEDLVMIIEEILKQRCQGAKNKSGVWITLASPKPIHVLEEDNVNEGIEYYYLTEMAVKYTVKRFAPDHISEKRTVKLRGGNCFLIMGCRSALSPWKGENGNYKFYGCFNQGVVTIDLVDVALSSGGDMEAFWKISDEGLDLCYWAPVCHHNRLRDTLSDTASTLWQDGALARLKKDETIGRLLYSGYSTTSLGYAGLYEYVRYMTGESHTDQAATPFALEAMEYMSKARNRWKDETNIGSNIYGSPIENTTYKSAKCLQKRFGIIEGVTGRSYITNSYHVNASEGIDAFSKSKFESQSQAFSIGGAISHVEAPSMQNNIPAVLGIIRYVYNNVMYTELNTKSDFCQECGLDGEIQVMTDESSKLIWECPRCGSRDENKLNVARRTCGYIGAQF